MSTPTQPLIPGWMLERNRLQQEVDKLTLIVNKINGLKLILEKDREFDIISEALYCAERYWYDEGHEDYLNELSKLDICAIIIKK